MVTWDFHAVKQDELPKNLAWHPEPEPKAPDTYAVKMLFAAHHDGTSFRKTVFPDGTAIFAQLKYKSVH